MRVTADADPAEIIAPRWWMSKGQFLEHLREHLADPAGSADSLPKVKTGDGSLTVYHPAYRQHFHSLAGAAGEAQKKYLEGVDLSRYLASLETTRILDIGFGLGYNALAAIKLARESKQGKLEIISLENDHRALEAGKDVFPEASLERKIIEALLENEEWSGDYARIKIIFADARQSIRQLQPSPLFLKYACTNVFKKQGTSFQVVFLDPFSPEANPELWTYDFCREIRNLLTDNGILATYSAAYRVRGALFRAGFLLGESPAFGRKKGGTLASLSPEMLEHPLPGKDLAIITKSTAGLAYRDPESNWSRDKIRAFRSRTTVRLRQQGIPRWWKEQSD